MKNKSIPFGLVSLLVVLLLSWSCTDEVERPEFPLSAEIFHSVDDYQVAFTALTHSATSWSWDFGDGSISAEKNPVHVYEAWGFYKAVLTATDNSGNSEVTEVDLAVEVSPYNMLTGGPSATDGKTWKLSAGHSSNDYFANANAELSLFEGTPPELPAGIFGQLGMGEVYEDEFTFHSDGKYEIDVKDDGAAFGGIVYQFVMTGGAGIVNPSGQDFGLCTGLYTPETDASFTYVEKENLTVSSVYGADGTLTYNDVSTLDFSGTEFIGLKDFDSKVIIQELTNDKMRIVMFMAASDQAIGVNTHALILSFDVVN